MKTTLKRVFSILCFFSSLSLLSFSDFDRSSSEYWRNGSHFDNTIHQSSSTSFFESSKEQVSDNSFSWIKLDNDALKIGLLNQKPTSIQIFTLDGNTQWYEFFERKAYTIRPNLSKGVYIARLFQGEKYNTMTFTVQ